MDRTMRKLEANRYYYDKETEDLIQYLGKKGNRHKVKILDDPQNVWASDDGIYPHITDTDLDLTECKYIEKKAYNTPLWRCLNE